MTKWHDRPDPNTDGMYVVRNKETGAIFGSFIQVSLVAKGHQTKDGLIVANSLHPLSAAPLFKFAENIEGWEWCRIFNWSAGWVALEWYEESDENGVKGYFPYDWALEESGEPRKKMDPVWVMWRDESLGDLRGPDVDWIDVPNETGIWVAVRQELTGTFIRVENTPTGLLRASLMWENNDLGCAAEALTGQYWAKICDLETVITPWSDGWRLKNIQETE